MESCRQESQFGGTTKDTVDKLLIAESGMLDIGWRIRPVIGNAIHIEVAAVKPGQAAVHIERTARLQA